MMASKKQTYEAVVEVLSQYDIPEELSNKLRDILAPKTGGKTYDISEVTLTNDNGDIVAILDSVTGVWLPATEEFFYADKAGKGIPVGDTTLKRTSKVGYMILSKHRKAVEASKRAIFDDVLNGVITPEEGKAEVERLDSSEPDYSEVEKMAVA